MRIITVSRQFGSGGRELGKRLSDCLGWDYYDREIITALSEEKGMTPEHIREVLGGHGWHHYQLNYRNSFHQSLSRGWSGTDLLLRQSRIIREIAELGENCVIVGRDADVVLSEYKPFRIFACAEMNDRLARCARFEMKKEEADRLTEKEILRNIRRIDRERRRTREVLTGKAAGDGSNFDLTVNTGRVDVRKLAEAVAEYSRRWFDAYEDA